MQERVQDRLETLWPYGGFGVMASERRLGEGKLTLTVQSLLFEPKDGSSIGFDFPSLRLVRLLNSGTVELAYSVQGDLRTISLKVLCTFPDGTERDEIPPRGDPFRMSLFRAITGGVAARFLADHSNARIEGLVKMTEEEFETRYNDLRRNIRLFPSKREIDEGVFWDENLKKQSLEEAELEPSIWRDSERMRLFYTGTNPSMTLDNALEKLDILQEDWVNGRINPTQRARVVALDYLIDRRQFELGYTGVQGESSEVWKDGAERLVKFENQLGVNLLSFI